MASKVYSDDKFDFIVGNYNEKFTFQTAESVKKGQVFKRNGNVIGLVVGSVEIDSDDKEARPVSVLVSGIVNDARITATDDEKKALLANTGIRFLDYTPASGSTQGASTTDNGTTTTGQ